MTFSLYSMAVDELKRLDDIICELKNRLAGLPDGELYFGRKDKYVSWYTTDHRYIRKCDRAFAENLAESKYLSARLAYLTAEREALSEYIRKCDDVRTDDPDALLNNPNLAELLKSQFNSSLSDELQAWMSADYMHSTSHPEKLVIPTLSGHTVRSRAESLICAVLYTRGIPFRYEEVIYLGKESVAPDIIARNIRTGEFCYWEHLGLLDSFSYRHNNFEKLELYSRYGIYPGVNLILTSETQEHPLNEPYLNKLVDLYLT